MKASNLVYRKKSTTCIFQVLCGLFFISLLGWNPVSAQTADNKQSLQDLVHQFDEQAVADIAGVAGPHPIVLLGESTHGTSEYYQIRSELSKKLIEEYGFNFVLVEGDWNASWQVNKYVKQLPGAPESVRDALRTFNNRWPHWMWNNEEMLELITWMRERNERLPESERAGFYGMDVYSFWDSIDAVARVTDKLDESDASVIEEALDCFLRFNRNHENYLRNVMSTGQHCGRQIRSAHNTVQNMEKPDGFSDHDWLYLRQNMNVILQGDLHYRGMLERGPASWNERVNHFKQSLTYMLNWYTENYGIWEPKGIVWAHNTHVGDARATDMRHSGMRNIGELARVSYGKESVFAIGFGTYTGRVNAGTSWASAMEIMRIPEAQIGSLEFHLNNLEYPDLWLDLNEERTAEIFSDPLPHRAIGVVYQPELDSRQNYVTTILSERYNAFIFIRETTALTPLD